MSENRTETLLTALVNDETVDIVPQSRVEEYLQACIDGTRSDELSVPQSRAESLLYRLTDKIADSEVVLQEKTVTENGEVLPDEGYDALSKVTVNVMSEPSDIDGLIDGSITEVTSDATSVRANAFYRCSNLTNINAPLVTSVGSQAFASCGKLLNVDFPLVTTVGNYAFQNCTNLTSAIFPLVTSMEGSAFEGCANLTSAIFPLVTSLGQRVFYGCSKLTSASLPSATSIGTSMFSSCYRLTSANLPSATNVGAQAFWDNWSLIKVILGTKQTTVAPLTNTNAFTKECYHILGTTSRTYNPDGLKDGYIYVPASLVADYRVATNWVTFATQIMPWVATVEELANIDGTTYDHACVGEGLDSVEYAYNGTTWEVFR